MGGVGGGVGHCRRPGLFLEAWSQTGSNCKPSHTRTFPAFVCQRFGVGFSSALPQGPSRRTLVWFTHRQVPLIVPSSGTHQQVALIVPMYPPTGPSPHTPHLSVEHPPSGSDLPLLNLNVTPGVLPFLVP